VYDLRVGLAGSLSFEIEFLGAIVERQELLNGTQSITFEGRSADDAWSVSGMVAWSRGLIDFVGEGDLTLSTPESDELYAIAMSVEAEDAEAGGSREVRAHYEVDGGTGAYEGATGGLQAALEVAQDGIKGRVRVYLSPYRT
jgi:hypothetical protein